ncbi:TraR/DksA family transcriptional regulator [Alteraurantiacibacter palmitatis]|uniref:TraR/DksA family transcriptional regulator n=1 Tax=Alteraurantiacibacter palmitatis TaxID=2054628 RepID=A0ABV7E4F3_9SPHN
MTDTTAAKARLEAQLAELKGRLARLESELDEEAEKDWDERANQLEDEEAAEGQAAMIKRSIASTERALDRIAAGTYGECAQCGAQISAGRLEARPEASLCIICAKAG